MTVSTTASEALFLGNGSTTAFAFTFIGVAASDLVVTYTDASGNATVLSSSQYSVSLNAPATGQLWGVGGTITYPLTGSPIASGTSLTVQRVLPLTQAVSISNQGNFAPQVTEEALDILEMQIQQIAGNVGNGLLFPASDPATINHTLPAAAARANGTLGFDLNGNPIVLSPTAGGTFVNASIVNGTLNGISTSLYPYISPPGSPVTGPYTIPVLTPQMYGAVCDGATDDSVAWGKLLAVASSHIVLLSSDSYIATGQTAASVSNAIFMGGGRIVLTGNYTALTFTSASNVTWSIGVRGPLNNQQYSLAVSGATIAAAFPSSGYTYYDLTTTSTSSFSAHATASKSGTTVTVALTNDAGLAITNGIGVQSSAISLTSGNRYVMFGNSGASGIATAAPRFYNSSNVEYVPGGSLVANGYDYLTGSTSLKVKVGTGRGSNTTTLVNISGYAGASYDLSQLSVYQLVNDSASASFGSLTSYNALIFSGGSNITVRDCGFSNLWFALEFISSTSIVVEGNRFNQCFSGVNLTASGAGYPIVNAVIANNNFDMRFQDDSGTWREQVFFRQRAIAGDLDGASIGVVVSANNILGANWGMEFINIPDTTLVQPINIIGNNVAFANQGLSFNATLDLLVVGNVVTSTYGFAQGGIECADNVSNGTKLSGNRVALFSNCAQTGSGIGAAGSFATISDNYVWAPIPIVDVAASGILASWCIKGNKL